MSSLNPTSALAALLAFTGWTALHVVLLGLLERLPLTLQGKKRANEFAKSRTYGETTFIGRLACHHQNCLENLPLFAVIVLVNANVTNSTSCGSFGSFGTPTASSSIDREAWLYVYSRLCHGLVHWYKVNHLFVIVRFSFFATGLVLLFYMGLKTAGLVLLERQSYPS